MPRVRVGFSGSGKPDPSLMFKFIGFWNFCVFSGSGLTVLSLKLRVLGFSGTQPSTKMYQDFVSQINNVQRRNSKAQALLAFHYSPLDFFSEKKLKNFR